jgi:uncharacterized protein YdgA (DUF945 family)
VKKDTYKKMGIAFAIVCFSVPYALGIYTHDRLNQLMSVVSEDGTLEIVPVEYRLGWLSSEGTSKLLIKGGPLKTYLEKYEFIDYKEDKKKGEALEFILHHEVQHGPFVIHEIDGFMPAAAFIKTSWDTAQINDLLQGLSLNMASAVHKADVASIPDLPSIISSIPDTNNPEPKAQENVAAPLSNLSLLATISLLGDQVFDFSSPELGLKDAQAQASINLKPLSGKINLNRAQDQLSGILLLPALQLVGGKGALLLKDMRWEWDLALEAKSNTWLLGNNVFSVQEADFQNSPSDPAILITAARAIRKCFLTKGNVSNLVDCNISLGMERAVVDHKAYGPISFEAKAQKLSTLAMAELAQIHKKGSDAFAYLALTETFLNAKPFLEISHFDVQTPEGPVSFKLELGFSGKDFKVNNFEKTMKDFHLKAFLELPQVFVKEGLEAWFNERVKAQSKVPLETQDKDKLVASKVSEFLNFCLENKWILPKDQVYVTNISLDKGDLVINNSAFAIPDKTAQQAEVKPADETLKPMETPQSIPAPSSSTEKIPVISPVHP